MKINKGVWPVMITPFTDDLKIDYDGVLKIIEWYDKMGVTGIFAVCQSSEMFQLNAEERFELAKFVIDNTPKHIQVVASGHVAENVEDQIKEAQRVIDAGVGAYVFISNQFAKEGESEDVAKKSIEYLIDHIEADSFGVYECPYPYKRVLSPELLKWCADTGKFSFLKDTCCELSGLKAKAEAVKGSELQIFNANGATLLESLKMGCAGYSGVMANFHPDLYVWLVENYEKEPERAAELMDFLGAASMVECQVYPVNSKYHMQLEGLNITTKSRKQDDALLTSSKRMEIEQFRRMTNNFRKYFFGK
ncbi:MAG: dihydrodipicolinate synthase family protein [Lachnospiraceae bacterium]|nr:dihydrodipicolinate synthase family protein [Lachnospiraceae bacterium]